MPGVRREGGPTHSGKRPWGKYRLLFQNQGEAKVTAKILMVLPHSRLSLQKHSLRSEYWFVMEGEAEVSMGGTDLVLHPGETVRIPPGTAHRLGTGNGTKVLEVSTGYFDEGDIVRLEDDYGRA
ncbi:MAG: phosphomannose isomerase type II C-terminal cupin domain [Nitrososphaerota archaeon]|nr:phosphomannose isomerase type II C-terminal cupin domain [Nitrososphaerota archaeon]MDG7023470.1 phosphomannose isomerase type II C-terminal cupin domain [Nitrososphaerota archaeon]